MKKKLVIVSAIGAAVVAGIAITKKVVIARRNKKESVK